MKPTMDVPWRWWLWVFISFFIVQGTIEMNMPEPSKTKEILQISLSAPLMGVVSIIIEVIYQILNWSRKKYLNNNERE